MRVQRRVAILGAGVAGICMGIRLKQSGRDDFVLLERNAGVGGTWHDNTYPGCECDIPSFLYCYSFEIKPEWSKPYATQPEILEYLESCVDKYDLTPHIRFGSDVRSARWSDADARWAIELASGDHVEAEVLVSGLGMFANPSWPDIEGMDAFEGTHFHSARWQHDHDLAGERVAVIGSAASAVQFVPKIVDVAAQVDLYQRTANWIAPKEDDPYTDEQRAQLRADPNIAAAFRQAIYDGIDAHGALRFGEVSPDITADCLGNIALVDDPELRAKLTPDYPWGCKRPLFSNDYYPAFNRPNLALVTDPIERVTATGVRTIDGAERPADTIVYATGFRTTDYLSSIDVRGRGGLALADAWSDGAIAYKGVTTAGFPNLFMLYGPNTNADSLIHSIEQEADYALRAIERLDREALAWIDVRPEAMAAYNEALQREIAKVEPWGQGCGDYYRAPSGRIVTQWPDTMSAFTATLAEPDADAYEVAPLGP